MNKKVIVIIFLLVQSLLFLIAAIALFTVDNQNKRARDVLLKNGIKTNAVVISKDIEVTRKVNQSNPQWQYINTYSLTFSYSQDTTLINAFNKSLKDYLEKETLSNTTKAGKLEPRIRLSSTAEKVLYDHVIVGDKIPIVFLYGKPSSARILNSKGGLNIPGLFLFGIIASLLFLASAYILYYYLKTGKTF